MKWGGKPSWTQISAEETKSGRPIAYRACRPSLVFILLILTMMAVVLSILDQFNLLHPGMMFIMVGAWSSIAASETDVNSPLNQTLMDKIRGNLDYLHSVSATIAHLKGIQTFPSQTNAYKAIETTIDWRNRDISVRGIVAASAINSGGSSEASILADVTSVYPNGTQDLNVYWQEGKSGFVCGTITFPNYPADGDYDFIDGMFYSGSGSTTAAYLPTCYPYLKYPGAKGSTVTKEFYIWVNSTDGNLMVSVEEIGGAIAMMWNLQITYSEALV